MDKIFNLKQQLKDNGYKLTSQREAVLDVILSHTNHHMSSEEIYEELRRLYPGIGLATVYRTLPLLEKLEILHRVNFDDGCIRYEIVNPEENHEHHHLICMKCGAVLEAKEDLLDDIEERIFQESNFKVVNHQLKFYGYCRDCINS